MAYNSKYTGAEVENLLGKINDKQDTISDLASIREGAAKGATALQPEDIPNSAEPMVCAYRIASYTANHIELENYTYNGQTMYYREGAIISILNPNSADVVFEGGIITLDGNDYESNAFTLKGGATALFTLGVDSGILFPVSSVVESNSGGSSEGGSSAYAEVNHGTSDSTFTLTPNTFHVWDEVATLDLSLGAETSGVANEYLFQFASGPTPTSLTLPDDIKFSEDLVIEANKIYQISILKGLGSVLSWDNGVALIENRAEYDGNTVFFQYPVASDLTIVAGMNTINISAGEQSCTIDGPTDFGAVIESITPTEDDTYYYTF